MGSRRLPGKVLADLGGEPLLARVLGRLEGCARADAIVVATTTAAADDPVASLARARGHRAVRGSEADVLDRYALAATRTGADLVVRVTADCPLLDPAEVDAVIAAFEARAGACDLASNTLVRDLPRGFDVEAVGRAALERAAREATSPAAREHVTWHLYAERPHAYRLHAVRRPYDAADLRVTVDTPEDLAVVRRVHAALGPDAGAAEVVAWLRAHPEVTALNARVEQAPVLA